MLRKNVFTFIFILAAVVTYSQDISVDSLKKIVFLNARDSVEIHALLNLAHEYSRKDYKQAAEYALQAIRLARFNQNYVLLGGGYSYMIILHQYSGKLDSAQYYLNLLEALAKANQHKPKLQIHLNQSAGLFYKAQGQYRKALPYMEDNLRLLTVENEGRAGQFLNIGNLYFNLSDFKKAVNYHLQSLALFEKVKSKRGQSFSLHSLGNDFSSMKQFERAEKYFVQSIKLKEELQDKRGIITSCQGLGDVYMEFTQFALSEKYFKRALKASREMKLPVEEARSLHQLGLLYKRKGNISLARSTMSEGLKIARQGDDSTFTAKMNSDLIAIDLESEREKNLEDIFTTNVNTFINSGDRKNEVIEYSRMSEYFAAKKQYDQAFYYLKKHEELKDSVEGKAVLLQIKQLEEQYQSEKKEREIALLKKDQELQALALSRERSNVILIAMALVSVVIISFLLVNRYRIINRTKRQVELERMRNTIARDLHDDIGSTLSSINIISQLALQDSVGSETHFQRIAQHSSNMMESMSDIVWSINPNNDSLEQVISKMKEFASEILDPLDIGFSFSGEEMLYTFPVDATLRKNLFLIFKEAINNAAKYSSADHVTIRFTKTRDELALIIHDNGKGFNLANATTGNGLQNMRKRAQDIRGALSIKTAPNDGTEILLSLAIT